MIHLTLDSRQQHLAANVVLAKLYLPLAHYNFDMPTALLLQEIMLLCCGITESQCDAGDSSGHYQQL